MTRLEVGPGNSLSQTSFAPQASLSCKPPSAVHANSDWAVRRACTDTAAALLRPRLTSMPRPLPPTADRPGRRKDGERPKRKPKPKNEGEYYRQLMHELSTASDGDEDDPILDAVVKARPNHLSTYPRPSLRSSLRLSNPV